MVDTSQQNLVCFISGPQGAPKLSSILDPHQGYPCTVDDIVGSLRLLGQIYERNFEAAALEMSSP